MAIALLFSLRFITSRSPSIGHFRTTAGSFSMLDLMKVLTIGFVLAFPETTAHHSIGRDLKIDLNSELSDLKRFSWTCEKKISKFYSFNLTHLTFNLFSGRCTFKIKVTWVSNPSHFLMSIDLFELVHFSTLTTLKDTDLTDIITAKRIKAKK